MKTKEYIIPEMEVVEMKYEAPLLGSSDTEGDGSTQDEYGGTGENVPN